MSNIIAIKSNIDSLILELTHEIGSMELNLNELEYSYAEGCVNKALIIEKKIMLNKLKRIVQ